jgi:hypothetical protein
VTALAPHIGYDRAGSVFVGERELATANVGAVLQTAQAPRFAGEQTAAAQVA